MKFTHPLEIQSLQKKNDNWKKLKKNVVGVLNREVKEYTNNKEKIL